MIYVHFLINKLDIEHIIALGGKKSNEKLGKKGNRCKNAANSVTGHVCVNSNIGSVKTGSETECENQIRRRAAGRCTSEF